jgi:hypothetical protein
MSVLHLQILMSKVSNPDDVIQKVSNPYDVIQRVSKLNFTHLTNVGAALANLDGALSGSLIGG